MESEHIDAANKLPLRQFVEAFLPQSDWKTWSHPSTGATYEISVQKAQSLSPYEFQACFNLIETTSSEDYKKSQDGWKPKAKKKEMRLLDLKYLLVKKDGALHAFTSFMPTFEDDHPVIYCYEIHLDASVQGTGLGKHLMKMLENVAATIPEMAKLMLTVFTSNTRAVDFYQNLGYRKDEYSPPVKQLRNGTKIEPKYIILSKSVP